MALTSSHFASAEKEFRFPLEYAGQRPLSTTWTVTGAGAFLLASEDFLPSSPSSVRITGITTGKIVDYGVKDSMHMGAAMAPAAPIQLPGISMIQAEPSKIMTGSLPVIWAASDRLF